MSAKQLLKGLTMPFLTIVLMLASSLTAFAVEKPTLGDFPYETKVYEGKTLMAGFDPNEYGGNDADCRIPVGGQPEMIHIGEVVSSAGEGCRSVVEWSLKVGTETIFAGVYALAPHEWFYVPKAVAGDTSDPRYVGTLYVYPKGWNAHRQAVYLAADRDNRDKTVSIVGLSPTDPYVLGLANAEAAGGGGAPGSSPAGAVQDQADDGDGSLSCTVTSSKARVNIRKNPSLTAAIVRTVATGAVISYQAQVGDWKKLSDTEFILGSLCVPQENDEADG